MKKDFKSTQFPFYKNYLLNKKYDASIFIPIYPSKETGQELTLAY